MEHNVKNFPKHELTFRKGWIKLRVLGTKMRIKLIVEFQILWRDKAWTLTPKYFIVFRIIFVPFIVRCI